MDSATQYYSDLAPHYSKYRPNYPECLFQYLTEHTLIRNHAWDCATGNGQAALRLVPYFNRITATDISEAQIQCAPKHEQITYIVTAAEKTAIMPASVDLAVIAQAIHWLDRNTFYGELKRVLKPNATVAVLSYSHWETLTVDSPAAEVMKSFYTTVCMPYWLPTWRQFRVEQNSFEFPFVEIAAPDLKMEAYWDLQDVLGFANSMASVRRYRTVTGNDPIPSLFRELESVWEMSEQKYRFSWILNARIGRHKDF